MTGSSVRVLLVADTHLGIDLPLRPRVERRRRGHDFFANFERVLDAALTSDVDLIVHGGDLFFRRRVPPSLVQRAFTPLKRVAGTGIPIYVVPGNHERSEIPYSMLALHPGIHIFDRPRMFVAEVKGMRVALAGFPYHRHGVRECFPELLAKTGWRADADVDLLCVHHCFEGATVGPSDYTFRFASDVVRHADVPTQFTAVLTGHVHRHQVLKTDLRGRALAVPVLYPGSIERTSFAEKDEPKGYMVLEFETRPDSGGLLTHWEFHRLPARPMLVEELTAIDGSSASLERDVCRRIQDAPPDAILRLRIHGHPDATAREILTAANLRRLAPPTMNLEVVLVDEREAWRGKRSGVVRR